MMKFLNTILIICYSITIHGQVSKTKIDSWHEDITIFKKKILSNFVPWNDSSRHQFIEHIHNLEDDLHQISNEVIIIRLSASLAPLQDGHTELSLLQETTGFSRIPFILYGFENDFRIVATFKENKKLLGSKVKSIEGIGINEVYKRICKILSADNDMEFLHEAPNYMTVPEILRALNIKTSNSKSISLTLENLDGETVQTKMKIISLKEYNDGPWTTARSEMNSVDPIYMRNRSRFYWFEELDESKTIYLKLNRIDDEKGTITMKKFFKQCFNAFDNSKSQNLIVDLRNNRGGNYKKVKPLIKAISTRKRRGEINKIFCITNRVTFSAAGVTSIFLKRESDATLVGEPSRSEPNGGDNAETFILPNSNLRVWYTNKLKDHYPELGDARIFPVEIPISLSYDDYINGADPMMKAIMQRL